MNNQFEQYFKEAKNVAMSAVEKERIFNYLETFIAEPQIIKSPYHFHFTRIRVAVLAMIVIIVLTTGTSYAAASSLPGDALYPVKINVNEKVGAFIAAHSGNSAKYESGLALRRLEEVEILSSKNQLDDKTESALEANFEAHASRAELALSATSSNSYDDDSDVAVNFQAGLIAHQGVLSELATRNGGKNDSRGLSSIISGVSNQITKNNDDAPVLAAKLRSVLSSATALSVADKLKSTASRIAETEDYLNKSNVSPSTSEAVKARLQVASDLINNANVNLNAQSYQDAYLLLDQATTIANQVNSSLRVQSDVETNVQPNINASSSYNNGSGPTSVLPSSTVSQEATVIRAQGNVNGHNKKSSNINIGL